MTSILISYGRKYYWEEYLEDCSNNIDHLVATLEILLCSLVVKILTDCSQNC